MEPPYPESPIDENDFLTIPVEQLAPETLRAIARELLLREIGNDIPESDELGESRIDRLIRGLQKREFTLTYNKRDESVGIQSIISKK